MRVGVKYWDFGGTAEATIFHTFESPALVRQETWKLAQALTPIDELWALSLCMVAEPEGTDKAPTLTASTTLILSLELQA